MKPSEKCKAAGLTGLLHLSELSGVSVQTLINWHESKPRSFELMLKGAAYELMANNIEGAMK